MATLLPTYGTFTGLSHQGIPPTGRWLEYGMVNIVRLEGGKLVEGWFGMDPLVELQQMGAAPAQRPRALDAQEQDLLESFQETVKASGREYDNVTAFDDVVVALGPPQHAEGTKVRMLEIFRVEKGALAVVRSHEFPTSSPYQGNTLAERDASRAVVSRFFDEVLTGHDLEAMADIVSADVLVHPAAMPCEAGYYGRAGVAHWLGVSWDAFPDLTVTDYSMVAQGDFVAVRWNARGTSTGDFLMLPPTGGKVEYSGVSMYRVEDDEIAEVLGYPQYARHHAADQSRPRRRPPESRLTWSHRGTGQRSRSSSSPAWQVASCSCPRSDRAASPTSGEYLPIRPAVRTDGWPWPLRRLRWRDDDAARVRLGLARCRIEQRLRHPACQWEACPGRTALRPPSQGRGPHRAQGPRRQR